MTYRVLNPENVTPQIVREWGYDEDLDLIEQDEDLLLYDLALMPTLLDLAADHNCPKRDFAFSILCEFCRENIARHESRGAAIVGDFWSAVPAPQSDPLIEWHQYVRRLLDYTELHGPIEKPTARQMANDLLLGIGGRLGSVVDRGPIKAGWWRFATQSNLNQHLIISAATGNFRYPVRARF